MKRVAALLLLLALALPATASAHATLVRTEPANGAVLGSAPSVVQVFFDDTVRLAKGNEAVSNSSAAPVQVGEAEARGRVLTIALKPNLPDGDYSVRWSIVSDDGHPEQGVLAFAVGAGRAAPHSVLGAGTPLAWNDVVLRTLYYLGLLAGGGAALFGVLARGALGRRIVRPLSHLFFFSMLAVFLGASGLVHGAPPGTRYALVLKIVVTLALAAGAAAALAPMYERLLLVAGACAAALVLAPTFSGHALDRGQHRFISIPVDLAHIASSSAWLGGLLALVFVLPRSTADDGERSVVVRRFSSMVFAAVAVLAVTGLGRALTELTAVSQVWSTSYGRALIIKTALFVPLLALGWLNRTLLLGVFARLRRSALLEIGILVAVVAVVAVLTELRPGGARAQSVADNAPLAAAGPAALPPLDAVVDAHALGSLAVAIARVPGTATITILGQDGTGASGRAVAIDGRRATACGSGCYRGRAADGPVAVEIDGRTTRFDVPARAPSGTALLRKVTRAYGKARTIVFDEALASGPTNGIVTRFTAVAPNRLKYQTRGGPGAIIVGPRRWDKDTVGSAYQESPQTPIDVRRPNWSSPTNVHEIAPGVLTFVDRGVPAWFHVELATTLPRRVRMTAAAHFMTDSYRGFDVPAEVSPPSR